LLVTQIDALRETVRQVRARAPFHIGAWVVLPDHMHCFWTLPEAMPTSPAVGARSRKGFRYPYAAASRDQAACFL
jgi:REP element-mobilizing transposase RayT